MHEGPGNSTGPLVIIPSIRPLLRHSPLVEVPEHAHNRVVADRTDNVLVPEADVGERVERQRHHAGGRVLVALRTGGLAGTVVGVRVDRLFLLVEVGNIRTSPVLTRVLVCGARNVL